MENRDGSSTAVESHEATPRDALTASAAAMLPTRACLAQLLCVASWQHGVLSCFSRLDDLVFYFSDRRDAGFSITSLNLFGSRHVR